ncbi:MAG: transposase, partial [Bacteroidota bacterium]
MSHRYKILNQKGINFLTMTTVGWIDVFTRKKYRDIIIENLQYCRAHKGLRIHGYVIMSNHIHLVASTDGKKKLSQIIRDFKSYTAKIIMNDIAENTKESRRSWLMYLFSYFARKNRRSYEHQFWQSDNHPMLLESVKFIQQKLDYIHKNPIRAG